MVLPDRLIQSVLKVRMVQQLGAVYKEYFLMSERNDKNDYKKQSG